VDVLVASTTKDRAGLAHPTWDIVNTSRAQGADSPVVQERGEVREHRKRAGDTGEGDEAAEDGSRQPRGVGALVQVPGVDDFYAAIATVI